VTKAVITVPAYFDETRRRATMDAGRLARLEVLDILNEPTAAAIDYGYQAGYLDAEGNVRGAKPIRVMVYDLGGGTFDVTIVEMAGQSFKAVATDGDVRLGGKDWDEKLIDMVAERFRAQHGVDPRSTPETLQEMIIAAENCKRTLTERTKATIIVNQGSTRFKTEVTREQLEEATAPLVLRTRTTTEIVLLQAGLSWDDIDKILLVGGSTRMPMISRMLGELTNRELDRSLSADEAVAHGAALYADLLLKRGAGAPAAFQVTNVNSHSLGIVGIEPGTGRRISTVIIPKNTSLPHTAARRFRTAKPNQNSVRICVLEGESEDPDACVQVGVATIRGLPPRLPAGWPVEVRYSYEENGRMQVTGKLMGHDAAVTVEFTRDNSLSDDDLMLWAECLTEESTRTEL
jgi:molecular chaperone DnaK